MAKIQHNNIVDSINDGATEAKKRGVVHLECADKKWSGNTLEISGREHINFGTCGYLGLENHPKIIESTLEYASNYGTQFSVSRSYLITESNRQLETNLSNLFLNKPSIVFTSTTIAHMSILPIIVGQNDAVILDQQVHVSVQTAAQLVAVKGVPLHIIRHNNMEMLEHKIKMLSARFDHIWYMIDGVYSMFGDIAPIDEINSLMSRYENLRLYVDDAHGMSWSGQNGSGKLFAKCVQNNRTMYMTTLAKGFGVMGGIAVFPNQNWYNKIILHGGPLAYSHPIPPPMIGAAIASAKIHLSDEIITLQNSLKEKLAYADTLLKTTEVPVLSDSETPIYFIGTGHPQVGYNLNKRLLDDGFYVNIGMFPAVPVKNTGLRFTITNHNSKQQIKSLIDALAYHYPKSLEEEGKKSEDVYRAFRLTNLHQKGLSPISQIDRTLKLNYHKTIQNIKPETWNSVFDDKGNFNSSNLTMLESAFSNNPKKEENWQFHYLQIFDEFNELILATFLTSGLFKDDLLSNEFISQKIELERKSDPYLLCSDTLMMGSLLSDGEHLYINRKHATWPNAVKLMLKQISIIQENLKINTVILRDFLSDDTELNSLFHNDGFFKVQLPNTNTIETLQDKPGESYLSLLSKSSIKHIKKDVLRNQSRFQFEIKAHLSNQELNRFYELYSDVAQKNQAINMFSYPKKLFTLMNDSDDWEFFVMTLDKQIAPVAVVACFKGIHAYFPTLIGFDYLSNQALKVYKQALFQLVCIARKKKWCKLYLGMSADIEKKKVGAIQTKKNAYISIKDQFNLELIQNMSIIQA